MWMVIICARVAWSQVEPSRGLDLPPGPALRALVIGNDDYDPLPRLANARSDAIKVRDSLEALGYTVTYAHDLKRERFGRVVVDFTRSLHAGDTAFVYYAGHAVQLDGKNYLIPVDVALTRRDYAPVEAIDIALLVDGLSDARSALNVLVLDACRNDPFEGTDDGSRGMSSGRGLASMDVKGNESFVIAFASEPGALASDSGAYAASPVGALRRPCMSFPQIFAHVRDDLARSPSSTQRPWQSIGAGAALFSYYPAGCRFSPLVGPDEPVKEHRRRNPALVLAGASLVVAGAAGLVAHEPLADRSQNHFDEGSDEQGARWLFASEAATVGGGVALGLGAAIVTAAILRGHF